MVDCSDDASFRSNTSSLSDMRRVSVLVEPGGGDQAHYVDPSRTHKQSFILDPRNSEVGEDFAHSSQPAPVYLPGKMSFPCAGVGSGF